MNKYITKVVIPDTVKFIGCFAFCGCHGLIKVDIPASVEIIEPYAFSNCNKLKNINVSADNIHYSSHQGVLLKVRLYMEQRARAVRYMLMNMVTEMGFTIVCFNFTPSE